MGVIFMFTWQLAQALTMEKLASNLSNLLEPAAQFFNDIDVPEPIVHWGHPLMMGIVIVFVGSFVAITGWRGRLSIDADAAIISRSNHRKMAPWLFLFLAAGYVGGLLSLVIQNQLILSSPHFWTGSLVIALLATNGLISLIGFGGSKDIMRTIHAYIGSLAIAVLLIHAFLGLTLGLSI